MTNRDDFLKLLLQREGEVRAFIGSLVRDPHVREDVLQEVALTLWQQFERYDPGRSFGAWARGIAARKVLERRRQDRRFPLAFSPETIQAVLAAFDRTEHGEPQRLAALERCVSQLPQRSRDLLALMYEHELSGKELALQTGRTVDAVYQVLSRIRASLADCIQRRLSAGREGD